MIYFDEAGNSGANLLDKDQPTYVLLSHDYSFAECETLLAPILHVSMANELHFKRLKKYEASRDAILECINHPKIESHRSFHFVCDKNFMIITHIVDQLVELVFHSHKIDFYKGGVNLSTANILHIMGNNCWDRQLFQKMCSQFVIWIRTNDKEEGELFYQFVNSLYDSIKDEKERCLIGLILRSKEFMEVVTESYDKYRLDPTLPCFVAHCNFWAEKYEEGFEISFDNSKQITYWEDMINFLTHHLPSAVVGYGSRKHKYPLLINQLNTIDSHASLSIQLSDIFASSLNYAYGNLVKGIDDKFSNLILESRLAQTSQNSIWPTMDVTPESLNMNGEDGINPLNFLMRNGIRYNSGD